MKADKKCRCRFVAWRWACFTIAVDVKHERSFSYWTSTAIFTLIGLLNQFTLAGTVREIG
jgi:hypothetical protein